MKKNDLREVTITGMTAEGSGVGHIEGMVVFVPASAVGDELEVKILKVNKNYAFGKIERILYPSSNRTEIDCSVFLQCGGCAFRHISYEEEKKVKEQRVKDAMKRIGGLEFLNIEPIIGAKNPDRYRNKAQYPIGSDKEGNPIAGFFAKHSHRIVNCNDCFLQPALFATSASVLLKWMRQYQIKPYDEQSGEGLIRNLYVRQAKKTGEIMVCIVATDHRLPKEKELIEQFKAEVPSVRSIVLNQNKEKTNVVLGKECRVIWGKGYITDELCGLKFRISPKSFYQVNHDQAQTLYRIALSYAELKGNEVLLDLYCGTGTIGLTMAHSVKKVIGIEVVKEAVEDAKKNATDNGIDHAEFICADAAKGAAILKKRGIVPDIVLLDPPRKGCDDCLIDTVVSMEPKRIVYVSCDPATLARDLKLFYQKEYVPQKLTPVDLFPRTAHVESVCLLTKRGMC